jgi:hypothetical protein
MGEHRLCRAHIHIGRKWMELWDGGARRSLFVHVPNTRNVSVSLRHSSRDDWHSRSPLNARSASGRREAGSIADPDPRACRSPDRYPYWRLAVSSSSPRSRCRALTTGQRLRTESSRECNGFHHTNPALSFEMAA